jgi:hypothetical protein
MRITLNWRTKITLALVAISLGSACSIFATRPVQDMSDTAAALRGAREVQADTLAPELYREATEYWLKARREYKFKNFDFAQKYAQKARVLAEQAEFEALRNASGNRVENIPDPMAGDNVNAPAPPAPEPAPMKTEALPDQPTPQGTPVEDYARAKAEDDAKRKSDVNLAPNISTNPTTVNPVYAPYPNPNGGAQGTQNGAGSNTTNSGATGTAGSAPSTGGASTGGTSP